MPLPSAICKRNRIKTLIAVLPCQSALPYIHALVSSVARRASERARARASGPVSGLAIAVGLARLPLQCRVSPAALAPCCYGPAGNTGRISNDGTEYHTTESLFTEESPKRRSTTERRSLTRRSTIERRILLYIEITGLRPKY